MAQGESKNASDVRSRISARNHFRIVTSAATILEMIIEVSLTDVPNVTWFGIMP